MSRLLPRYTQPPLTTLIAQRDEAANVAQAELEQGPPPPAGNLRGIPVIARGIPGTIPGTNPLAAITRTTRRRLPTL